MKLLLLAGEESGALYAKGIAAELRELLYRRGENLEVRGYADYGFAASDLAVMGFLAVLRRIRFFMHVKRTMERAIDDWRPDVVCTIDYPGMNLKLAAFAKRRGIRTVHVVCPQVWAWKRGRVPKIEASVDRLLCFFPFEPSYFRPGFAEFVGHPLADIEGNGQSHCDASAESRTVALLPGSRISEIRRHFNRMLKAVDGLGVSIVIPAANARAREEIERELAAFGKTRGYAAMSAKVVDGDASGQLRRASCAVVASGTASLEAALVRCPSILVYDIGFITGLLGHLLIKGIHYVGLANIIWEKAGGTGEPPMPELLQSNFTAERVRAHLKMLFNDAVARQNAVERLDGAMRLLTSDGAAFSRIAQRLANG